MIADRRALARGCLLAATLFAACVDGPTSPGTFGELRIRPSYPAADAPSALGLSVDSARVRIVRPGDGATPLVDARVTYTSDTASLGWLLELIADEESMQVDIEIWDDGARVYEGNDLTLVRDGSVANALVAPVMMAYVGPAIADTVIVAPDTLVFDALGDTTEVRGEVRDRHGVVIEKALAWTSEDETVATVDAATGVVTAVGNGVTTIHGATGPATGSVSVSVSQRVHAVTIAPTEVVLPAIGATQQFTASAEDRLGSEVAGATIAWSSSAPEVASVDPATGVVTAVAGGSATITATGGDVEATATVTVSPVADVASVTVSPTSSTLTAVGATQQFTAVARDAAGNALAGIPFTWTSTALSVATIDPVTGLATATGNGESTIGAIANGITGTATLGVDLTTTVASVVVEPSGATLTAVGATQQFTATARDGDGAVIPGIEFAWASSATSVASVNTSTGLATAIAHGEATISATAGGVSGVAVLAVELTQSVASITVSPTNAALDAIGDTQQFTATAFDASGAVVPGLGFLWTSDTPDVASIDPATGVATATGHGGTTIAATANGITGTATLDVDLAMTVASISVEPDAATLREIGSAQRFTATALDASGTPVPGIEFRWTSSAPTVATIDPATGLAIAVAHGETEITATANGSTGTATLVVDLTATVSSVSIDPDGATLTSVGATQQFTATARDADGTAIPGIEFVWASSAATVATVNASTGLAKAEAHGETTIAATANGISGTATLTVDLAQTVTRITVSPGTAALSAMGDTQQFTATAFDAADAVVPGITFVWTSSAPDVAGVVGSTGLVTAAGHGETTISATANGVAGTATLSIDLTATVATVSIDPDGATLTDIGATQPFTATARDADGVVIPGISFVWTSSAAEVASVNVGTGLATATGHGEAAISATTNGVEGVATLTVNLTTSVATILVSPDPASLLRLGSTQQFTAVALDAGGAPLPGIGFLWTSSAPSVASIDPSTALATAAAHGETTIAATAGGITGTSTLVVDLTSEAASVVVVPIKPTLTAFGQTQQFSAEVRDASGALLPGVPLTWTSSDDGVATLDASTGLATAVGNGTTTVIATVDGVAGTTALTVTQQVSRVEVSPATATIDGVGASQQFTARAYDANDNLIAHAAFTWASFNEAVATVGTDGLATAHAVGTATIKAYLDGHYGYATLTVR